MNKEDGVTNMEINISNTNANSQIVLNDLKLLELLYTYPFLLSNAVRTHGDKDYEQWGWDQIVQAFNMSYEGFDLSAPFSVDELKWRWEILRPICPSLVKECGKIPDSLWYIIGKINRLMGNRIPANNKVQPAQKFVLQQLPLVQKLSKAQQMRLEVEVIDAILTHERNIRSGSEALTAKANVIVQNQYDEFLKTIRVKELPTQFNRPASPFDSNGATSPSNGATSPSNGATSPSNGAASDNNDASPATNIAPSAGNITASASNGAHLARNKATSASNKAPSAGNKAPAASNKAPSVSNKAPSVSNKAASVNKKAASARKMASSARKMALSTKNADRPLSNIIVNNRQSDLIISSVHCANEEQQPLPQDESTNPIIKKEPSTEDAPDVELVFVPVVEPEVKSEVAPEIAQLPIQKGLQLRYVPVKSAKYYVKKLRVRLKRFDVDDYMPLATMK